MKLEERFTRAPMARGWPLALVMIVVVIAGCSAEGFSGGEGEGGFGGAAGGGGASGVANERAGEIPERIADEIARVVVDEDTSFAFAPTVNAVACTTNSQCSTGYCVDGFCCDSKCDNKCMACSLAKKGSGVDGVCGSIKYDTDPDNDCPNGACDGKNMCKNYNGYSCTSSPQCLSGYCVDGVCCGNICMGACQACSIAKKGSGASGVCGNIATGTDPDNECNPGECNGSGACNAAPQPTNPNGTACSSSAQCASGYCADGVCCDSWCLGTCQACTAAKKNQGVDGVCGAIANDKDPDEECWGGACNGSGVCKQYNGVPCSDKSQCLSGYCVDGFCCGNVCTQWCYACSQAKKGQGYDGVCGPVLAGRDVDNECTPGECNGSGACNQTQTPLANGSACIVGAQCASGSCVDGVCCDTACNSICKACTAVKKGSGVDGTCGNIAAETDPDKECPVGGKCGGNGTCRFYNGVTCTAGSQCFSNYCVDGVCCGNVCSGTCYACTAAKKGQGSDGTCGAIATTRDPDNECNPGECNGSGACNASQPTLGLGAACTMASQCISGNCADGVCCDSACTATCQACKASKKGQGTNGTCGPIVTGTDPDNECANGDCNGAGTCVVSLCPAAGTAGSCGTPDCPPCQTLILLGTGTNGVSGTFLSSGTPQWIVNPYSNEPSADVPALAALRGQNKGMAFIRRSDNVVRYSSWTPMGFSAWNSISAGATSFQTVDGPLSAFATTSLVHVASHQTDLMHLYMQSSTTTSISGSFPITFTYGMPQTYQYGPTPGVIGAVSTGPVIAYASSGQRFVVQTATSNTGSSWVGQASVGTSVAGIPALATFDDGMRPRDIVGVYRDNSPLANQLYWVARESGNWTMPAAIPSALSAEPVLVALSNGDVLLAYCDATKKVWWSRLPASSSTWSIPMQPPGNMAAASKPSLAVGAGDAEAELLFVDDVTRSGYHARLHKGAANFTNPAAIPGATDLMGIAAVNNYALAPQLNGASCTDASQCASGNCVDGVCCDTACSSTCMACSATKKGSGNNGTCGMIATQTDPDGECGATGKCNGEGACRSVNGAACTTGSQCFSNECVDGVCCDTTCTGACQACSAAKKGGGTSGACGAVANGTDPDNECNPGECNGSGACNTAQSMLANGAACTLATQCSSGFCVDGVCCDTACTGTCQACSATKKGSGTSGTCASIKYDTDPDNECPSGACSGTSLCQYYNGVACSMTTQCLSKYCVDGYCCNNSCTSTCSACSAAKKGTGSNGSCGVMPINTDPDNECALVCNGTAACIKAPLGSTCKMGADCVSGFCADGVCCNSACAGACGACSVPGAEGICLNGCSTPCTGSLGLPGRPLPPIMGLTGENVAIDAADLNRDGNQDLVIVQASGSVNVLLGQGNATFGAPTDLAAVTNPQAVATGDLNADTFVDVVVASSDTGGVSVFLNQGNGTFAAKVDYATGAVGTLNYKQPDMLRIGDLNGDGVLDLATANTSAGTVSLLLGNGDGTFASATSIATPDAPMALAIANFNGDAFADLAVTTYDSATSKYRVSVMLGQGGGAFAAAVHYPVVRNAMSLVAADINGDGFPDLVSLNDDWGNGFQVFVLINQGNGAFAAPVAYEVMGAGRVIATDLNGDTLADLVVTAGSRNAIHVLFGQANGTLATRVDYSNRSQPYSAVAADLDNDGDKDVVTSASQAWVVFNNSAAGDLGDPIGAAQTFTTSGSQIHRADVNTDGILDLVNVGGETFSVSLGQANGTFGAPIVHAMGAAFTMLVDSAMGDLNGDGKPDLVYHIMTPVLMPQISVRLNQGGGNFGPATDYAPYYMPFDLPNVGNVILGDFDANGTLDVATSLFFSDPYSASLRTEKIEVMMWINGGNGTLSNRLTYQVFRETLPSDGFLRTVPIVGGDFNGDGKTDLAVADKNLTGTRILLSQGNAQFTWGDLLPESYQHHVADVNGDGRVDVAGLGVSDAVLRVWLNNATGTFSAGAAYPEAKSVASINAADMNGDGSKDLVFVDSSAALVGVMLNQGGGVFGARRDYAVPWYPWSVATGDWNNDGRLDIAVQNGALLLNTCLP